MSLAFFTVVTASHLARARVLCESVALAHPGAPCYVMLAGTRDAAIDACAAQAGFELVYLDQLGLPAPERYTFRFEAVDLCTSLKAHGFLWLFANTNARRVIYLDSDTYVLAPLAPALEAFDAGASVLLTPHLNAALGAAGMAEELDILHWGSFNLGFAAVSREGDGPAFAAWWASRMEWRGQTELGEPLTDQRWLDLAPALFAGLRICRDPGLNVAYWNLAQREIARAAGGWQVNGRPLALFHFSGFEPAYPDLLNRRRPDATLAAGSLLHALAAEYAQRLMAADEARWRTWPHAWGTLADGTPVLPAMRAVFRRLWDRADSAIDPRRLTAADFNQPTVLLPQIPGVTITHLMYEYWRMAPRGWATDELTTAPGQSHYAAWFAVHARRVLGWPDALLPPAAPAPAPRAAPRASTPANPLRRWGYKLAHESYLHLPGSVKAMVRRHRPVVWREFVRRRMMPALHAHEALRARVSAPAPGITVAGYLAYSIGLGESARATARALAAAGLRFNLHNLELHGRHAHDEPLPGADEPAGMRDIALMGINADGMLALPPEVRAAAQPGQYRIGQWYWELEGFPADWMGAFEEIDEVWAGSPFIRECVAAVSPRPVLYMPQPLEARVQRPYRREEFGLAEGKCLFLFSFDFDSYVERKNPRACVEAFRLAFADGRGDVMLVLKTLHAQRHPEALAALKAAARGDARIAVLDVSLPRDGNLGLISVCDVYLSLHRAEGLGQGMAEAMCLGKPVVATGYSGNLAFMDAHNSCLVGYRRVPVGKGHYPYGEGQSWAEPDLEDAARHLRRLADDPALRARIGENAKDHMARNFSAAACGERMRQRLAIIRAWRDRA